MCAISGLFYCFPTPPKQLRHDLHVMQTLLAHRGPDDHGIFIDTLGGFAHRRLSTIDTSMQSHQPLSRQNLTIVFNGTIYNHCELREQLKPYWTFSTMGDTEVILAAFHHWREDCVSRLRGMFAFAIWDGQSLFCARDRFGMKPFYFTHKGQFFGFASEMKALLPFLPEISTDQNALAEYLTFNTNPNRSTLFSQIEQLPAAHTLTFSKGACRITRYWEPPGIIDADHSPSYFQQQLEELLNESLSLHLRADIPIGSYASGGMDSSLISALASQQQVSLPLFHGRFAVAEAYDESPYALALADKIQQPLHILTITPEMVMDALPQIIYHLDTPVAGPGAIPQYLLSGFASQHVHAILGGQGGDELFGGYARYLIAYFEQCLKTAIEGEYQQGNFVVTIESIIPNLSLLNNYKPLLQQFWSQGLFGNLDERYYRLINRSEELQDILHHEVLDFTAQREAFFAIFNAGEPYHHSAYLDRMLRFDQQYLLPGLLHVEDRTSMAHGLESRLPFLDHKLYEFICSIPANIKFRNGQMKALLKDTFSHYLPQKILNRQDKMGFPVPLKEWSQGEMKPFMLDILQSLQQRQQPFFKLDGMLDCLEQKSRYGRRLWLFLSYELWHQQFHDRAAYYRRLRKPVELVEEIA